MRAEIVVNQFIRNFNADVNWIFVGGTTDSESTIKNLIPNDKRGNCSFAFPLSDLWSKYSEAESAIRKTAANSMMFNLVFLENISDDQVSHLYTLFFYLKNLGFCGVILVEDHNTRIQEYCAELNVHYSVLVE